MKSTEVRQRFLSFFKSKGHPIIPSGSLVPASDPSLLFTGAGMNQFKDYFLGVRRDLRRAASVQKCFRTGDVEQVGKTPSHLTFFEMLGNFSFGDYFKKEAISFAWEFLTTDLKISPDRLWASVYDKDAEAAEIWTKNIGLKPERIVRFGAKDNFWPSNAPADGPNGPCGPCSEIYFDYGCCFIGKKCPDPESCSPACSCGRFVEIWNLVFTQFDRQSDGSLPPLPAKNIDTGMGLERLTAMMQDKMSVFETDLFAPIVNGISDLLDKQVSEYMKTQPKIGSIYAIADHLRALVFLINDGVVPSNEKQGYVLRKLLRKAERIGLEFGLRNPFLNQLVPYVVQVMGESYPELIQRRKTIAKAILIEENRFWQTLEEKIPILKDEIRKIKAKDGVGQLNSRQQDSESGSKTPMTEKTKSYPVLGMGVPTGGGECENDIRKNPMPDSKLPNARTLSTLDAETAARFYDTHGLSYDEIVDVCEEMKVTPPSKEDFEKTLEELQAKSKASSKFAGDIFTKDKFQDLLASFRPQTTFIGYTELSAKSKVIGLVQELRLVNEVKAPAEVQILLDRSPFYGESGGQVGDTGTLEGSEGKLKVLDTQWAGNLLIHQVQLVAGKIRINDPVEATVDVKRRRQVAQNHTATHLLHSALRKVLGEHVMQAGSLVAPDHLRLDFSHGQGLSHGQRESVESLVNEWVKSNLQIDILKMSLETALASGAMALFGEKYKSSEVRVVRIGEVSLELCGGTHLHSSHEIGLFRLVEERSVASGVRRVKALTDKRVTAYQEEERTKLAENEEKIAQRTQEKEREEELQRLKVKEAHLQAQKMTPRQIGPFHFFVEQIPQSMGHVVLRSFSDAIRKTEPEAVIFLEDSEGFCIATSSGSAQLKGVAANQLLKLATEIAGGSGGGRPELAQGRLKELSKFPEVQFRLENYVKERV